MQYISTRGQVPPVDFSTAVAHGLAPDGGLYLPETLPDLKPKLADWADLSYPQLCDAFFSLFATDLDRAELSAMIERSYQNFDHAEIAPVRKLSDSLYVLELFHGPTLAFKDFALQLLGNFYEAQIARTGKPISVLGATSGDTGAAAIHGLLGKKGVRTFILYPDGRISPLQERQMTCTGADNVFPLAIKGSFDDAQAAMKTVFEDREFADEIGLSAVNSINLARILAQCVYYLYSFYRLPAALREQTTFVVPTGNFGNVLAGWLLQRMGVPIKGFRVATNQNDILHRLFQTGTYALGDVAPSVAPSMDIQVASNFERFIYYAEGCDPDKVRAIMQTFKSSGQYTFENFDPGTFSSSRTDDAGIASIISEVYRKYSYVVDPHTACGFTDLPEGPNLILATAHPAKFPDTIAEALSVDSTHPSLEALKAKEVVKHFVEPTPEAIKAFMREHKQA
ncbi:threonine synthase [Coraliomargarita sinensis]|uniref:Threonine synthase n=1 Tax=Coraliomargarita sinensis TaxID=2174842 RepID=A0A317ZMB1_9BACT|nr:threonine synthase [Coraliomargarita sinensis]PXA04531.1 threonine synthase [Coraliomargarita sinensis]